MPKKTKLIEIAEKWGDKDAGALNPRTIDGVVLQISTLAESAFGPKFISELEEDISLTEASYPRHKAVAFLVSEFITRHLAKEVTKLDGSGGDLGSKMGSLQPLSDLTYTDYFMAMTGLERYVFRTPLERACSRIHSILSGYTTVSPYQACEGIVFFFKETKNPLGLFQIIQKLCDKIKAEAKLS